MPLVTKFRIMTVGPSGPVLSPLIDEAAEAVLELAGKAREYLADQIESAETDGQLPPRLMAIVTTRVDEPEPT